MSESSFTYRSITRATASKLIAETIAASERIGFEAVVAVVDAAGNLKALERSDRSSYFAVSAATDKAYTAAAFGSPTDKWVDIIEDRDSSNVCVRPRFVAAAGGFSITEDGQIIGGLGVSGGTWSQDQQAAEGTLRTIAE
ncbi:heme-binding protein [Bradyrhizobium sp. Arg237L]|uniref:GlcG/HbpS family heme-binding protein n=1 Tax=Bradyrhizobium sp. Arg237L TaxID=3003352 RepID=UPI00249E87C8|nr:heme-binding protein [Bradyrhizobium sp. Arg237L]MDI4234172.1 heme-binding protein [Bradyrhizobium sp. Arg237L]